MENVIIRTVSLDKSQAKVTVIGLPDQPGVSATVFKALARESIGADLIVQNTGRRQGAVSKTDLSFTVDRTNIRKAAEVINQLKECLGFSHAIADENIGKLSIVGVGLKNHSETAAKMFRVLAEEGINIQMISTSEINISIIIDVDRSERAVTALQAAFMEQPAEISNGALSFRPA